MLELVQLGKAFADLNRVRILAALRGRELCVCELCDSLSITQSTLSSHLQVIRAAGLVTARKKGKWMYYALSPGTKRPVDVLFGFFSGSLRANRMRQQDERKLTRRLSLRNNGACCVGFVSAKPLGKGTGK